MSEENKALIRRYVDEVWSQGNLGFVDTAFAPDFVPHFLPPNLAADRDGLKVYVNSFRSGLPDLNIELEDLVAEANIVAFRWMATEHTKAPS